MASMLDNARLATVGKQPGWGGQGAATKARLAKAQDAHTAAEDTHASQRDQQAAAAARAIKMLSEDTNTVLNPSSGAAAAATASFPLNSAPSRGPRSDDTTSISRVARLASLPPGAARIVDAAQQLFEVRSMQQHWDLVNTALTPDVVWQAPIIATHNKHDLRVAVFLAKSIATLSLDPHFVEVLPLGPSPLVCVDATVTVRPKRWLLFPPSLLLPDLPIRATLKLGVRGDLDTGKIELIDGRWHNLPSLPGFLCHLNGLAMGSLMHLLEPLWARGLPLVGDDSYHRSYRQAMQLQPARPVSS